MDVFCTNAIIQDEKAGDKVRAAGKDFWQYSFVGYSRPEDIRYTFGFFFGYYDSRGSLCWAYNWENGWDTMQSGWRYAWQTPFGTIPGNFFEGIREGWDDRRVIETYKKQFKGNEKAMAELTALLKDARKGRGQSGKSRVNDFFTGVKDPSKLEAWRNRLLDRMVAR